MVEAGGSRGVEAESSEASGDQDASVQDVLAYHDASGGQITFTGLVFLVILKAVNGVRRFRGSLNRARNDENPPV